jgi:hypothetical protein
LIAPRHCRVAGICDRVRDMSCDDNSDAGGWGSTGASGLARPSQQLHAPSGCPKLCLHHVRVWMRIRHKLLTHALRTPSIGHGSSGSVEPFAPYAKMAGLALRNPADVSRRSYYLPILVRACSRPIPFRSSSRRDSSHLATLGAECISPAGSYSFEP